MSSLKCCVVKSSTQISTVSGDLSIVLVIDPIAGNTRSRNLCKKLAWKIRCKFVTVSCSCTTTTASPANHVARFVSRAGQFLCRNRAVFYCVQGTCTRKKLVPDWPTHVQVSCTRRLAQVSDISVFSVCHRRKRVFLFLLVHRAVMMTCLLSLCAPERCVCVLYVARCSLWTIRRCRWCTTLVQRSPLKTRHWSTVPSR